MINHGRIHRNTDEFAEAFEALGEAETIFRRLDNKGYLAETLNELGSVYRERGSQEDMAQAEKYFRESILSSGDNRKVDNLTDMAMMFAQAGKAQETQTCLAEAEPLIVKLRDIYYRGQTHEIRANLYFAEGEGLQDKQPKQAHKRFQQAFDASLDAALAYVECMRKPFQFHRAERRYRHVLDLIQRKLDICPRADISSHTERLTKRWRAQNFEDKYNDLLKTLEIITNDIDY
jgi:tetratricopeptide (TPR) repeat protein